MIQECGAKVRYKNNSFCQQPAMANGRCRLHGGLSTGPKTQKGKQKARQVAYKHGFYSKASVEERRQLRLVLGSCKRLIQNQKYSNSR